MFLCGYQGKHHRFSHLWCSNTHLEGYHNRWKYVWKRALAEYWLDSWIKLDSWQGWALPLSLHSVGVVRPGMWLCLYHSTAVCYVSVFFSLTSGMASGMLMSVCRSVSLTSGLSVLQFVSEWNWIVMKFCKDIQVPQSMNPQNCDFPQSFNVAPATDQMFHLSKALFHDSIILKHSSCLPHLHFELNLNWAC